MKIIKPLFLFFAGLLFLISAHSQTLSEQWHQYDSLGLATGDAGFHKILPATNGGIFIAGSLNGDNCVYHFDSSMHEIWKTVFNSNGIDIDLIKDFTDAGDGTLYVCGYVYEFSTKKNTFLARIDTMGSIIWEKTWNGAYNGDDIYYKLALMNNGNIACAGGTQTAAYNNNALLMVWSSGGSLLSYQEITGDSVVTSSSSQLNDLIITPGNEIIACGQINNDNSTGLDGLIVCYNSSGTILQWKKVWHDTLVQNFLADHFSRIITDNNAIYIGGAQGDDYNAVMFKYDFNGNLIWSQRKPGKGDVTDMKMNASGDIYYSLQDSYSPDENFNVQKISGSGTMLWYYDYIPPTYNRYDHCYAMQLDQNGDLYLCGTISLPASNSTQALLKLSSSGSFDWIRLRSGNAPGTIYNIAYNLLVRNSDVITIGIENNLSPGFQATFSIYDYFGNSILASTYDGRSSIFDGIAQTVDSTGNIYCMGAVPGGVKLIKRGESGIEIWNVDYFDSTITTLQPQYIIVDTGGNVYVSALATRATSLQDIFILKYNSSGVLQWTANYAGSGTSNDQPTGIAYDETGNLYVSGSMKPAGRAKRAIVLKFGQNGNYLWSRQFIGTDTISDTYAGNITLDGSNIIYFTYSPRNAGTGTDAALVRMDSLGNITWATNWNSGGPYGDFGYFVNLFPDHSIGIVGQGVNLPTGTDILVLRYDSAGSLKWNYSFASPSNGGDIPACAVVHGAQLYLCGYEVPDVSTLRHKFFAASIDTSGTPVWQHMLFLSNYFGSEAKSIAVLPQSGMTAITGYNLISSDIAVALISPSGIVLDTILTGATDADLGVSMHAAHGKFVLGGNVRSNNNGNTVGVTIQYCASPVVSITSNLPDTICLAASPYNLSGIPAGGVYTGIGVQGNQFNPANAGPGYSTIYYTVTDTVTGCNASGSRTIYIDPCSPLAVKQDMPGEEWKCFPVPAHEQLTLFPPAGFEPGFDLEISSINGQKFFERKNIRGNLPIIIPVANLEDGMYFLIINDRSGKAFVKKIIIE